MTHLERISRNHIHELSGKQEEPCGFASHARNL
jgi:hypothetical protein